MNETSGWKQSGFKLFFAIQVRPGAMQAMDVLHTQDATKDIYADSDMHDQTEHSNNAVTTVTFHKEWLLKKMNKAIWDAVFTTASSKSRLDSPEIEIGPEFAIQARLGTYSERDPDLTAYIRVTRMPRGFSNAHFFLNLGVQIMGLEKFTIESNVAVKEQLSTTTAAIVNFPWMRSNSYIDYRSLQIKFPENGLSVSINGSIAICTNNGYTMNSHILHEKHDLETKKKMHWTETIGLVPDATVVLRGDDSSLLHVHSCLLMANSPFFAAQFTSWKESTDQHSRRIDMKAYEPLAVRALINCLYLQDSNHERSLRFSSSSSSSSSSSMLSENQWQQLADTFILADQHYQYGLMTACMQRLTSHIPANCLRPAKRLCRFDMQLGEESAADRICKEFKRRILQHVGAHIERFLEVLC